MSLVDLYVRDKYSGRVHKVGDDQHDSIWVDCEGTVHYFHMQCGDGCTGFKSINQEMSKVAPNIYRSGFEFVPSECGAIDKEADRKNMACVVVGDNPRTFVTSKDALEIMMKISDQRESDINLSQEQLIAMRIATASLATIDQIKWERDMAISQLHALGYHLGERTNKKTANHSKTNKVMPFPGSANND